MAHRRPRPINVKDRLAIITDEQQIHEIDVDCSPEKPQIKVEGKKRPERERRYVNGLSMLPSAQMVPIPLFREIKEDKVSKKQRPFEFPSKYITYDEPTPDEEEHIIDYDMDSEDEKFLTTLNNQSSISSAQHLAALKEQEFEALFDLFEKTHQKMKDGLDETFPKVIAHLFRMIRAEDTEDATCAVCNDGEYSEDNMIIFCDGCNIGVHQACYGLKIVPPEDFYCDRCKYIRECETSKRTSGKNSKIPQVRCEFCTVKTGAFKPLMYLNHNGKHQPRWAHVSCAMWIPECSFSNTPTLDPILALPVPSRNKHKCCVCNEKTGVSFKCSEKNCEEYFHVMCGRSRDFSMYARPACVKEEKNKIKKRTLNNNNNNTNIKNKNNSNNNTDYNGNLIDGDHLEFVQYCEIHSLKSEIQRTDSHFGYSKLTDEELAELDAFVTTSRGLTLPAYSTELVYWYWRWRRKHHTGSFLRKFHALTPLTTFFDKHRTTPAECLEKMKTMRQHFETLRILLDLMKKREQFKKELIETRSQSVETEFKRLREYIGWWQTPRRSPRKSPAKRKGEQDMEDEIERYFQEEESEQEEEESQHDVEEDDMVLVPEYFEEELQLERQQLEEQQKQQQEENVELLEAAEDESIDVEDQDDIEIVDPELIEEGELEQQIEEEQQQEEEEVQEQPEDAPAFSQELPALIEEPQQQADEPVTLEQQQSEDIPNEDEEEELPREEEEFSIEFGEDQEIDYSVSSGGEHEAPAPTGSLPVTPTRNTVDSDSDVSGAEESYDSLDLEVARNKNFASYWEDQERLNKLASIRNGFSRGGTMDEPIVIDDVSEVEEIVEEKKVQKKSKRKRVNEKNVKSPDQPRKKRKKRKRLFSIIV